VLDGCAINDRRWVFYSAGTNVGFEVRVRDVPTGVTATYENPDLTAAAPVQDTRAFACSSGPGARELPHRASAGSDALPGRTGPPSVRAAEPSSGGCADDQNALCIEDRFLVEIDYQTSQGGGLSGQAQPVSLSSLGVDRGGLFYFLNPTNPEVLIKVLDGCSINDRYWVFYSAGTNLGLEVRVTDTVTGQSAEYANPDLTPAAPVQDTSALPCQVYQP
jgi:hypothetical protein